MGLFPDFPLMIKDKRPKTAAPSPTADGDTAAQMPLITGLDFAPLTVKSGSTKGMTIDERFAIFHGENPHVYDNIVKLALKDKASGQKRGSCRLYVEILRWVVRTNSRERWAINNDFTPLYARLISSEVPELEGFFEERARTSKRGKK